MTQTWRARPRAERRLVLAYMLLASLTLAHAIYLHYGAYFAQITTGHPGVSQQVFYAQHNTLALTADHPLFQGRDHAPDQYRVGVEFLGKFLGDRLGMRKYYVVFTVFDLLCAVAVGLLCYGALVGSAFFRELTHSRRTVAAVALLVAFAYPLVWVVPWQHPETLPSALYLTVAFALLGRVAASRWWLAAVAAATLWQGFVRADVALTLGLALLVLACTSEAGRMFGSRGRCVGAGALIAGIAFGVQAWLKLVLFPLATYPPDTKVVQLLANFGARPMIAFAIAVLPWALIVSLAVRYRRLLDPADVLAVVASCLYVPLWWTVGMSGEVRLFVPFLLVLTPTAAKLVTVFLANEISGPLHGDGADSASAKRL